MEPPDAIDHVKAAFKSVVDYIGGLFTRGCGTNMCDSSDDSSSVVSDSSEMPRMQACNMPLHGLDVFDADLFYQAPVQQLRFSARHQVCFNCPRNGHRHHPVQVEMTAHEMSCLRLRSLERKDHRHRRRGVQSGPFSLFASGQFVLFLVGLVLWMSLQAVNAMDADDGSRAATKIPLFSGKKTEFAVWIMKLTAVATIGNSRWHCHLWRSGMSG
jgi:hypothetical protein